MKKLLLLFTILFSFTLAAQDYIPMLQDGNKWGTVFCSWGDCYGVRITEIIGDENINDIDYKVVGYEGCFLREENGVVYVLNDDLTEDIFLDFTLELGDWFYPDNIRDNCLNLDFSFPLEFKVADIQSQNILGENRKILYMDYYENGAAIGLQEVWIEGIGSTYSIGPGGFEWDNGMSVVCFTNNGENVLISNDIVTATDDPCIKTFGISDFLLSKIKITPNPVFEIATLTIPQEIQSASINVYDVNGKQLMQQDISEMNTTIDFSSLTSGMYFYSIYSENKLILTRKLLVE